MKMPKINHIRIFIPMVEQIGNIIRINKGLINAQMEEVDKIKKIKQFIVCGHCRNFYAASFVKKYTPIKCQFCNPEELNAKD